MARYAFNTQCPYAPTQQNQDPRPLKLQDLSSDSSSSSNRAPSQRRHVKFLVLTRSSLALVPPRQRSRFQHVAQPFVTQPHGPHPPPSPLPPLFSHYRFKHSHYQHWQPPLPKTTDHRPRHLPSRLSIFRSSKRIQRNTPESRNTKTSLLSS
jgi:hypothetical protein